MRNRALREQVTANHTRLARTLGPRERFILALMIEDETRRTGRPQAWSRMTETQAIEWFHWLVAWEVAFNADE